MDQYAKNFNRIAGCTERRAELLGRVPRLADLGCQLSIRGRVFRRSTVNAELSSVRRILDAARFSEEGLMLHPDVTQREWITRSGKDELEALKHALSRPGSAIIDEGEQILARDLLALDAGSSMGIEEATDMLSGRIRTDVERVDPKSQRYLTWRDLRSIELELSSHDPLEAILNLKEDAPANIDGLLRMFTTVMWFTGMRPIEIWDSVLFVPRTDIPFTREMAREVRMSPEKALLAGYLHPVNAAAAEVRERNLGNAAANACFMTGAPAVLMIRSAKQTNANAAKRSVRLQVLENIPKEQLSLIAMASLARFCHLTEARKDNLRSSMGRVLKKIVARDPAMAGMRINLYSFRHSFASRVKLVYEAHEAAALTGHTSRASLAHYGERNLRSAKGKVRPEQWLPSPDPQRAKLIRSHWESGAAMSPEVDHGRAEDAQLEE